MSKDKFFISEALCLPLPAIEYHIGQNLATLFPNKAMIEGEEGYFNVEEFAQAQHCTITLKTFIHNQLTTHWVGPEPQVMHYPAHVVMVMGGVIAATSQIPQTSASGKETIDRVKNAWLEVEWQGNNLEVLIMNWGDGQFRTFHYWILADNQDIARSFYAAVCKWNMEIRGEVLVFDGNCWYKDEHLFQDIKGATL